MSWFLDVRMSSEIYASNTERFRLQLLQIDLLLCDSEILVERRENRPPMSELYVYEARLRSNSRKKRLDSILTKPAKIRLGCISEPLQQRDSE